jgi:predicted kinase/GNAT superfamily N-acetyltransferase
MSVAEIRRAVRSDLPRIVELFEQVDALHRDALPWLFRKLDVPRPSQLLEGFIDYPDRAALVAADSAGAVQGMIFVVVREMVKAPVVRPARVAEIENLVVDRSARRQGVGRSLVQAAVRWAGEVGATRAELGVYAFNEPAQRFWATTGFAPLFHRMSVSLGTFAPLAPTSCAAVARPRPIVHFVCGFLGAGKTTYAKALAALESAIRFSIDELYLRLFADGPTHALDQRALDRLLGVVNELWPQVAEAGTHVVLDFGFWRRALRDEVRKRASAVGADTQLHWLRCADDLALARCLSRNGAPDSFLISAEGFAELKSRFEPPASDEACEVVDSS